MDVKSISHLDTPYSKSNTKDIIEHNTNDRITGDKKIVELEDFLHKELWNMSHKYAEDEITWKNTHRLRVFLKTPFELEKVLLLLFSCCLDNFLCFFTIYPMDFVRQILRKISNGSLRCLNMRLRCYILYTLISILCLIGFKNVQIPYLYHIIKKQSYMKLYVLYNMMEITDKLLSSIGYDVMDYTLLLAAAGSSSEATRGKTIFMFVFTLAYAYGHVLVMLIQLVILNVAVFSQSNLLFIVVLSNQFTEVKSHVFKKFDQKNLLNVVNYDGKERFYVMIMLSSTFFISCFRPGVTSREMINIIGDLLCTLLSEICIDWIKHSFITKFNYIDPDVYRKQLGLFSTSIIHHVKSNYDSCISESIVRKIGFHPLPLVILTCHVFTQFVHLNQSIGTIVLLLGFLYFLFQMKRLTSVVILVLASRWSQPHATNSTL